ncbi:MAG: AbrB/MazE/SpoVT family DNA-binding domain-containing protein [Candidatus Micrarchaeota archaeon]|nr:AbrB/MazE/SpoVT family DNA-binding domain-containing protein [Candidatus Micrarchaeota archaeon]
MEETVVRARKLGGSLVVRIPKEIVDEERIVAGEAVRIKVEKLRKDWFGAFKGLKPFRKGEELDEH